MTIVTVITEDKAISVDNRTWDNISHNWPADIWAIQWDGSEGVIEYRDMTNAPATLADVQPYIDLFNSHDDAMYQTFKTEQMALDVEEMARRDRDNRLTETDWWALSDTVMTDAQRIYRQALRDLPQSVDWNPTWTWVDTDSDRDNHHVEITGITWPTKP